MATPNKLQAISKEKQIPLDELIPSLLAQHETVEAVAQKLGVKSNSLFRWLQRNGYKRQVKIVWVKAGSGQSGNGKH